MANNWGVWVGLEKAVEPSQRGESAEGVRGDANGVDPTHQGASGRVPTAPTPVEAYRGDGATPYSHGSRGVALRSGNSIPLTWCLFLLSTA